MLISTIRDVCLYLLYSSHHRSISNRPTLPHSVAGITFRAQMNVTFPLMYRYV